MSIINKYQIEVHGTVQGVFFRASTASKAKELSINGFVKNLPNGNVYIEAEGTEENLQAFIAWCRKGPIAAKVVSISINKSVPDQIKGFVISR